MMQFCAKHNLHYISDEIYGLSVLPESEEEEDAGPPFISALAVANDELIPRSHVHVLWSLSKDLAASGIRLVSLCSDQVIGSP